jgi:hypothetical protein
MFSYAERRRVTDSNPVLRTAQPKLVDKPPEIFSVDELAALKLSGIGRLHLQTLMRRHLPPPVSAELV